MDCRSVGMLDSRACLELADNLSALDLGLEAPSSEEAEMAGLLNVSLVPPGVRNTTPVELPECYYYRSEYEDIKRPLILGFATAVSVGSVCSNILLSAILFRRDNFRRSPLFFLAVLACVDIFMAFSYLALMSTQTLFDLTENLGMYHVWLQYFRPVLAVSLSLMTMSTYLIVAATFERAMSTIAAARSLHKGVQSHRGFMVLLCLIFGLVLQGTRFWEIIVLHHTHCLDFEEFELAPHPPLYFTVDFHFYFRSVCQVFIPFFLLMVMNSAIIINLRRVQSYQKRGESVLLRPQATLMRLTTKNSVRDATRMLVACVTLYLISNSLSLFVTCWEFFAKDSLGKYMLFYTFANDAISLLPILCGLLRLPVYCVCNLEVRRAVVGLVRGAVASLACRCGSPSAAEYQVGTMIMVEQNGRVTHNGTSEAASPSKSKDWLGSRPQETKSPEAKRSNGADTQTKRRRLELKDPLLFEELTSAVEV